MTERRSVWRVNLSCLWFKNRNNREVVLSDFVLMTTDARIDEVQLHSVGGHVVTKVYKYARQVSVGGEIWRGGDDFTTSVQ